jgi:hypothetical protein
MTKARSSSRSVTRGDGFGSSLSILFRLSQPTLYAAIGVIGAVAGLIAASAAVFIMLFVLRAANSLVRSESLTSVLLAALHFGIFASFLGTALFLAGRAHRRQVVDRKSLVQVALLALAAGALTGGLVQALHNGVADSDERLGGVVVVSSWILVSALLGTMLSRFVPNLDPLRGLIAGLLAGLLAGCCGAAAIAMGMGTSIVLSFIGYVIVGATLGSAMWMVERHFWQPTVEVFWTPKECSRFPLGPEPITIGGNAHILIPNAPAQVSSIELKDGQIEHIETANQKRTILKDGSRLRVGELIMVVHSAHTLSPRVSSGKQAE